jgi:hypothetical protein
MTSSPEAHWLEVTIGDHSEVAQGSLPVATYLEAAITADEREKTNFDGISAPITLRNAGYKCPKT